MTDLEITKLCADAMGVEDKYPWNPLHDDAQCMAMMKRFEMQIDGRAKRGYFVMPHAVITDQKSGRIFHAGGDTINQAICRCVAEMQKSLLHSS